jgi:hypothetical protein
MILEVALYIRAASFLFKGSYPVGANIVVFFLPEWIISAAQQVVGLREEPSFDHRYAENWTKPHRQVKW